MPVSEIDLDVLEKLAREAGRLVLQIYNTDFVVEYKTDKSPLTLADTNSHKIICMGLDLRYPEIPVLSEEGKDIPWSERREWTRFWLLDPLDGTKEFVNKNGEFTINIALIENGSPVAGVIFAPVTGALYIGQVGKGAWRDLNDERTSIKVAETGDEKPVRIVKSRSHPSKELETFLGSLPGYESADRGSSLKFCAVAEGSADLYPRLGPTWEWDSAAGQAIVEAAGGVVVDMQGNPFKYNKENLLNEHFFVAPGIDYLKSINALK